MSFSYEYKTKPRSHAYIHKRCTLRYFLYANLFVVCSWVYAVIRQNAYKHEQIAKGFAQKKFLNECAPFGYVNLWHVNKTNHDKESMKTYMWILFAADRCDPVPEAPHVIPSTYNTSWWTNVSYSCQPGYEWDTADPNVCTRLKKLLISRRTLLSDKGSMNCPDEELHIVCNLSVWPLVLLCLDTVIEQLKQDRRRLERKWLRTNSDVDELRIWPSDTMHNYCVPFCQTSYLLKTVYFNIL